jgi:hypothetical protein
VPGRLAYDGALGIESPDRGSERPVAVRAGTRMQSRAVRECGAAVIGLVLALATACALAPTAAWGAAPRPAADGGFTTILDGGSKGTPASLDRWVHVGAGAFVPSRDGRGVVTTGGIGMLWYPEDFGNAIFRIDYRDVRTTRTGYSNGGVLIGFPAEQICTPLYPSTPACIHAVRSTTRPARWSYRWRGLPGPFPPAQTYANDPALGDPDSGTGNACGRLGRARTDATWVAIYCGNEIQINDSPDPPAFGGDPIKTGSIYGMHDLNATTGIEGSGAQARLDADVAAGWNPGKPRAWHQLEIQRIGQQLTVFIDGVLVNRYDNAIPQRSMRAGDPPSSAREFAGSAIGLQNHAEGDRIEYRDVRVKAVTGPPLNISAPQITASRTSRGSLHCSAGRWRNVSGPHEAGASYQWFRSRQAPPSIGAPPPTEAGYGDHLVGATPNHRTTAADTAPGSVLWCRVSMSSGEGTVYAYAEAPAHR